MIKPVAKEKLAQRALETMSPWQRHALRMAAAHYTYDDIHDHLETMNRFSSITAQEKFKAGGRFRWIDFLIRPGLRFLKAYVLRRGFLDGKRGFLIALVSSFGVFGVAGLPRGATVDEGSPLEPFPERRDVYSHAKLRQEQLFRE